MQIKTPSAKVPATPRSGYHAQGQGRVRMSLSSSTHSYRLPVTEGFGVPHADAEGITEELFEATVRDLCAPRQAEAFLVVRPADAGGDDESPRAGDRVAVDLQTRGVSARPGANHPGNRSLRDDRIEGMFGCARPCHGVRVLGSRNLNDALHAALARTGRGDRRLVRRAGLFRPGALSPGPAGPGTGGDLRRPGDLHRARTSRRARTSGNRWAGRRSGRSGATGPTSRPTGRPTTCTARRPGSSTTGPRPQAGPARRYADLSSEARGG